MIRTTYSEFTTEGTYFGRIAPIWIMVFLLQVAGCRTGYRIDKMVTSDRGMVVSAHPLASEVGLQILKRGGTAADAAIATQLALAVTYPRAGNIGGGGFLVYRDEHGSISTLDYREKAPLAAHRDMFLDTFGQVIEGRSLTGIYAPGVPGTVAGLAETHRKLGQLPWKRLVRPSLRLARAGFRLTRREADRLNGYRGDFVAQNAGPMPFVRAEPWEEGDRLKQPRLAHTLKRFVRYGPEDFYSGALADSLTDFMQHRGGLITSEDLQAYRPVWREPITHFWRGYTLHTMGLPSSGGILIGQILGMIDADLTATKGPRDADNIHLLIEAERRAFADRAAHLGDPDFINVPVDSLLRPEYLRQRMDSFRPDTVTPSTVIQPGHVSMIKERFETTHLAVVDAQGRAASVTTTLNGNYGCKVWVPGGGYFLNNEMDDFSSKPGTPNMFGLIGGEANAIAPGKRMLSSMSPTIIEREGRLWMVLGTNGGSAIITSVIQVFLNAGPFGMPLEDAVALPRYHHQWLPDEILMEPHTFSPDVLELLAKRGHRFRTVEAISMFKAIRIDPQGIMTGVGDLRGDDHAAGW